MIARFSGLGMRCVDWHSDGVSEAFFCLEV